MTETTASDGALDLLESRRSTPARLLGDPAPTPQQLERLLGAAVRVPDHGKLAPWRLLAISGAARDSFGAHLARIHREIEPGVAQAVLDKDRDRYAHAPLVVVVIARIDDAHAKIPAQEQLLSAGCVAYNLLLGAHALGFGAQWLTGWAAYDASVGKLLGLRAGERVVGFVHIGTPREMAPERNRPDLAQVLGEWRP